MGGGTGTGGLLQSSLYNWEVEEEADAFLDMLWGYMKEPLEGLSPKRVNLQGPPVTPMVFKYPDPVVSNSGHCCFAGCDPLPCGCCRNNRTWCPHSVAPYGKL